MPMDKRCSECGQPMLPKGVKKLPNEYDHAQGCPIDKPVNPQATPESVQGPAMSSRFAQAVLRAHVRVPNEHWSMLTLLEQELAYTELVEALEGTLEAAETMYPAIFKTLGGFSEQPFVMRARAVLAKIAIKEEHR